LGTNVYVCMYVCMYVCVYIYIFAIGKIGTCVAYFSFGLQGLRATVDKQAASLGKKIRNAELGKVPLTAVVGVEERDNNSLSVRVRKLGDIGSFSVDQVMSPSTQTSAFFWSVLDMRP